MRRLVFALALALLTGCGAASDPAPASTPSAEPVSSPTIAALPSSSAPRPPRTMLAAPSPVSGDAGDAGTLDASSTCSPVGTWHVVDTQSNPLGVGTCAGRTASTVTISQSADGTLLWVESEFSVTLVPFGDAGACSFAGAEQYAVPGTTANAYFKRNVSFHGDALDGTGATFFHDEDAGDPENNCSFYSSLSGTRD